MSNEDPLEVRQENEIQALKAIFNDDLRDLSATGPWKIWKPPNIVITLSPLQDSAGLQEVHAQLDLHIICSENYPNKEPVILLEHSRGISDTLLQELKTQLVKRATELKGEVMVFELAQQVQAFLHEHNKPRYKSFYEEMLSRQRQQEELKQQAKEQEESRERQVLQNEIHRRQEILRLEVKSRREYTPSGSSSTEAGPNNPNKQGARKSSSSTSENKDEQLCQHRGPEMLIFDSSNEKKVQKGKCLSHSDRGCIIYSALDLNNGDMLTLTEWKVNTKDQDANILKHINSCDQEFTYLSKLTHSNIVKYLHMKSIQEKEEIVIYILQEYISGTNCNALFLKGNIPAGIASLRHIASGVLSALEFLHRNNVVHKELRNACIFIDSDGIVKVSGYSLEIKLWEITTQIQKPESYNKKTDIYKFGLCMLSLLRGSVVDDPDISYDSFDYPADLTDFLTNCLIKDEKNRFNATELLAHPFLRIPLCRMSPKRICKENALPEVISPRQQSADNLKRFTHSQSGGPSRIQNEFEVLQWLGRGAFGDVLKVRNKLDAGDYAIKRIELDPKNKPLNRKITREVKLLSRLNHENVVRYYNSWIESAVLDPDQFYEDSSQTESKEKPVVTGKNEFDFGNEIELLAPPIRDVEWAVSYDSKSKHTVENSSPTTSEDESSDEEDWMEYLPNNADSSDSIEFEHDSNVVEPELSNADVETKSNTETRSSSKTNREIQFMYIQMEFCKKSTLRTAIDDGLHSDIIRIWRLFREIVEGLAHIHQQGMIHRDLKPVNIFLDSNDHVKIGDFGLATTNIIHKHSIEPINKSNIDSAREVVSQDGVEGSLTGHIGTALYVAPELSATAKAMYNQKVDLYSLGILFFEMCYGPLNTTMERIKVLSNIRLKEIVYPDDFLPEKFLKERAVISLLLNHDESKRPTSQELLQSENLPPPVLEERTLRELVRHTLTNPQSKTYKYLVASCFGQELSSVEDITYYMSLPIFNMRLFNLHDYVKQTIVKVFKLHGGQCLSTPLLMPKSHYYEGAESCVRFMTHSGSVVSIPHDLRVPFARYLAWNNITSLKRYSIERVYREKKMFGFHPRELYECAFDIVTPTKGNLMADAELLSILDEILNEFSDLKNKTFLIRVNHVLLLKAMLLHCGIPQEKHNDICSILSDARDGKYTMFQIKTHLISLCLTDSAMRKLFNLIETDCPIEKLTNTIKRITNSKGDASLFAKQGQSELKQVIDGARALGVKCNIVVSLGLAYNFQQYSGMMCQLVCEMKKRRRGGLDVLAAGGRYDSMLSYYRLIIERSGTSRGISQSAVGISISLDKFVQALQEEQDKDNDLNDNLDVLICSQGSKPMVAEKARILRDLWSAGIKCSLIETQTLEEIQDLHAELRAYNHVILKDTEQGMARVRHWEKDRFQEKKINISELTDFIQRQIKTRKEGLNEGNTVNPVISKSDSRYSTVEHTNINLSAIVKVIIIPTPGKTLGNNRKRLENQIYLHVSSTLQRFTAKEQVVVFGLHVDASVLKTLAAYLDIEYEETVQKSIYDVSDRHPRHKKYLLQICDEILEIIGNKQKPVIVLYSITDEMFKVLM